MLSSITPFGERGRNNRYAVTATFFVAGSIVAGAATGGLFGALGRVIVPDEPVLTGALLALSALAGALLDSRVAGLRVPTMTRQVDERWLHKYRGWVYGIGFGAQLGTGLATIVSSAAVYLMMIAALLSRSVAAGLAIGLVFGAVRGLSLLLASRIETADALRQFHRRLAANARRGVHAGVAVQGASTVVALVAAWSLR